MDSVTKRFINILYVSAFLLVTSDSFAEKARQDLFDIHQQTVYMAENYPPANFFEKDVFVGVSVELLREIWEKLNLPKKQINVVSWSRGYRELENSPNHVLFTMSRTAERNDKFKWVGPVFSSTHVLVAKVKHPVVIDKVVDIFNYNIATVRGDISEQSLHEINFPDPKMAKVSNVKQAFVMLKNDRVDLVMLSIHGLHHVLAELHESRSRYKIVWQVNKIGNYFAFHKDTPELLIREFQHTLDALESKRIEILKRYELPEEEY